MDNIREDQDKVELLTSIKQVMPLIEQIIERSFPELNNTKIVLGSVKSDSVFLESRPVIHSLLSFKVKYKITINPKLLQLNLPLFALEGILAHELAHTAYYVTRGRLKTALTIFVFFNHHKHVAFERLTDIDAITRGYGKGIKAYREIVFQGLSENQKRIKSERYFSVEELDEIIAAHQYYPQLREGWLKEPPLNIARIQNDIRLARRDTDQNPKSVIA